jgi:hypothetical protein
MLSPENGALTSSSMYIPTCITVRTVRGHVGIATYSIEDGGAFIMVNVGRDIILRRVRFMYSYVK